ncbi:hypothetical protein GTV32_02720 [Gordonia sp. SID5947]|uniref:hypothetical protein n=1 Tax=Gordonia sp. SID5947 TaxID=2690315 RepID=UPI00136F3049|nr:hypothetical protein [Gordonia sp. SID5947]MYR05298.1 hypothetical protein [Gordonia sp. SID5947]
MIDSDAALERFCDLSAITNHFIPNSPDAKIEWTSLELSWLAIDWEQLADMTPQILRTHIRPYGLDGPSYGQILWDRAIERGRDHRPIAEQAETLRYRHHVPKRHAVQWHARLTAGEDPEAVAASLRLLDASEAAETAVAAERLAAGVA